MFKKASVLCLTTALLTGCFNKDKKEDKADKESATASNQTEFSTIQVTAIKNIIDQHLKEKPEVVAQAIQTIFAKSQQEAQKQQMKQMQDVIDKNRTDLYETKNAIAYGSKSGDVTLVVFADYADMKSLETLKGIQETLKADKQLHVVFRPLPSNSAASQKAARVAIAMHQQGLFDKFNEEMLKSTNDITETSIMNIAANIRGVNVSQLEQKSDSAEVKNAILFNKSLADKVNFKEAPGFVVGDFLVNKPLNANVLQTLLKAIRKQDK